MVTWSRNQEFKYSRQCVKTNLISHMGEGNGTPLQHYCLENTITGEVCWAAVHGVAKSQTRLSSFTFTFHLHALEKDMATHSSVLAWRIPGTGEPAGLPSMGSHSVWHDWSDASDSFEERWWNQELDTYFQFSSVAQSCPTLWPYGLQHSRLPCPSPTPRACSNSCPYCASM